MSRSERDATRIVRLWLEEGSTAVPDHVLDAVLDQLPATPQRRPFRLARRTPIMNNTVRLIAAAAAVVVVALIGYQLFVAPNVSGPGPAPEPSPTPTVALSPSPAAGDFPPAGWLEPGRYPVRYGGISWSFEVTGTDWYSDGEGFLTRKYPSWAARSDSAMLDLHLQPIGRFGIYEDPCGRVPGPLAGPSAAEVADAVASVPGLEATGPTDVTMAGLPAKLVVLTAPHGLDCPAGGFYYLWYGGNPGDCGLPEGCYRYATVPPVPGMPILASTIRVWIVDAGDSLLWVEGETYEGASEQITLEFQAMVESIQAE